MKDRELEMYKGFFNRVENIIKDDKEVSDKEKLIIILIELENMMRYKNGRVFREVDDFIQKLRVKSDDCETDNVYVKDGEMKSFSKEAEEFARKRVDHEMSYTCGMDFTDEQIKWIKDHIYTSVRNAYQSTADIRDLQEIISDRCQIVSGNKGNRAYRIGSKEPEKDRYLTNKELAMWLAQGNGLATDKSTGRKAASYSYREDDDERVDYINMAVRKWEDDEWHEPTYNYCFGDK